MLEPVVSRFFTALTHFLTGSRAFWEAPLAPARRVYYGNHSSHGDFVLIWSALPPTLRNQARPVAAADYWQHGRIRRYLIHRVFKGVLIERRPQDRQQDPIAQMAGVLDAGSALILFPEGTRNPHPQEGLLPFKGGIYHLAKRCDELEFVPVWLENLNRAMPKGRVIPLPLLCTAHFGRPLRLGADETKPMFLERSRNALLALAPEAEV